MAEIATPEDIEKIEAALEANRNAIGDVEAFRQSDVAFHLAIAEISKNPVFYGPAYCDF
ncbi:MAG: FCD domain-containing protein [Geminicoccales bacterium]